MVLVLCILMSAYFIRGITGFGSALISVPLLALSQPLTFAVPLVLALDFTASLVLGGTNRKKAVWSEIKGPKLEVPPRKARRETRRAAERREVRERVGPGARGHAVAAIEEPVPDLRRDEMVAVPHHFHVVDLA